MKPPAKVSLCVGIALFECLVVGVEGLDVIASGVRFDAPAAPPRPGLAWY